jgi:hypothetical protein
MQRTLPLALAAVCVALLPACASEAPKPETVGELDSAEKHFKPKWTNDDEALIAPVWTGDDDHGTLFTPLWRGAFLGIEDYAYAPANGDCRDQRGTVYIEWSSTDNTVHIVVKGKHAPTSPAVHRQEGTEYQFDKFHDAPKDITDSKYKIWIVLGNTATIGNFYYDPTTLDLLGNDFNFPDGPPNPSVKVQFPMFSVTGSRLFEPDASGFLYHEYTLPYDKTTVESGDFSRAFATFCPANLCEAAPLQPGISQLRPYVSPWLPASQAPSWRDMLHSGIGFDLHIDDASQSFPGDNSPYIYSGIHFMGNHAALQGGIPNGFNLSLLSAIQNVTPQLNPTPDNGAGSGLGCFPWVNEPHFSAPLYCQGQH